MASASKSTLCLASSVAVVALVDYSFWYQMALPAGVLDIWRCRRCECCHKAKGAESWFVIGPIDIQPAEFMKIGVVLMLAGLIYYDDLLER